jgi:AcrR family transcriptional regulator
MKTEAKFKYALKEMMRTKPLSEINVTTLCNKCHCHRQTFYYHYQDIYDLLAATFMQEDIEGLEEAKDIGEVLQALLKYSKDNFSFLRSCYNSAASDLVDDFYFSKIMTKFFLILSKEDAYKMNKNAYRVISRRYAKVVADEFGYWFKNLEVTPLKFEKKMRKFIENSTETLLPAIVELSVKESKK